MKILRFIIIIGFTMLIPACGHQVQPPERLNQLYLLYATPCDSGYLPLKIFPENDSLFVQYIKNGKPLEKVELSYNHQKKGKYDLTNYYYDEIIDGQRKGIYQIPQEAFDTLSRLSCNELIYKSKGKSTRYVIEWSLSKNRKQFNYTDLDYDNDLYVYALYEQPVYNLLYSIFSNPNSMKKISFDELDEDNIITSKEGNLRILNKVFLQEGHGCCSLYPFEVVQFKDGNNMSSFGRLDWSYENFHFGFCPHTSNIRIHTLYFNSKRYYLIDRAIISCEPKLYESGDDYYRSFYSDVDILQVYTIDNGELVKKELFKRRKKAMNQIAIEYDGGFKGENLFKYDEKEKIIYVPLVAELTLMDKYALYKWNGKHFTYIGVK